MVDLIKEYDTYLKEKDSSAEKAGVYLINDFFTSLIDRKENSRENLIALASHLKKAGNRTGLIHCLQILEREEIARNISSHAAAVLGNDLHEAVFKGLELPPAGSPPESALAFTRELTERLEKIDSRAQDALACNAHGIPSEAFAREKEFFDKAGSLEEYLKGSHERAVANLQNHADSGEVWFEQIITQDVVDYVKSDQRVLGGVLNNWKIHLTKIPYKPDEWLKETDPVKKRYLTCHCPMARESLKNGPSDIPPLWCHCSAGFAKQKFMHLFGQDLKTEVLESVLAGGDFCRFTIEIPE